MLDAIISFGGLIGNQIDTAYCTVGKHEDKSIIHPPLVTRSQLR